MGATRTRPLGDGSRPYRPGPFSRGTGLPRPPLRSSLGYHIMGLRPCEGVPEFWPALDRKLVLPRIFRCALPVFKFPGPIHDGTGGACSGRQGRRSYQPRATRWEDPPISIQGAESAIHPLARNVRDVVGIGLSYSIMFKSALISFLALIVLALLDAHAAVGLPAAGSDAKGALTIQVQTADGTPVANATVVCVGQETNAVLKGSLIEGGSQRLRTDDRGRFNFDYSGTNAVLVIATDTGLCLAQSQDLTNRPVLVLQAWGRIEGVRTHHGRPFCQHRLSLQMNMDRSDSLIANLVKMDNEALTDSGGRFVFDHVPPVEEIYVRDGKIGFGSTAMLQEVDVHPGESKHVDVATHGRTVVGRIEPDDGIAGNLDLNSMDKSFLGGISAKGDFPLRPLAPAKYHTAGQRAEWWVNWLNTTEQGRQLKFGMSRLRDVVVHQDGSFTSEQIEPGSYVLRGFVVQNGRQIATLEPLNFVVAPDAKDVDGSPVDAGKTTLKSVLNLKVGDAAPDFTVPTLDGSSIRLSNLRGKYVLLDFWAAWCGPCVAEMPNLKATYEAFGKNQRFVLISLSFDSDPETPRKFVKTKGAGWIQAFFGGDRSKKVVAECYGITAIPQIMLIGPDGKIIARDLRGATIKHAVAAALGK